MSIYDIPVTTIDGNTQTLEPYKGKVLLIVNVASKCGFTPQYNGLAELQTKFRDRGFTVLGFPCNQFLHQEPGDDASIKDFCVAKYRIDFPLFSKIEVNGSNAHPLYQYLKSAKRGFLWSKAIKWNFTKFLVDAQGRVVKRYATAIPPSMIAPAIERLLPK